MSKCMYCYHVEFDFVFFNRNRLDVLDMPLIARLDAKDPESRVGRQLAYEASGS
jgi:hypothetical protein